MYTGRGVITVHFLPELQYSAHTGRLIYKPLILDEKQLLVKQDWPRSHKSTVYPRTVTAPEHMLFMTENKEICAPNICIACDYLYSLPYS